MKKQVSIIEMSKDLLLNFTRFGLEKGGDFTDITIYDLDRYAEDWINENFDVSQFVVQEKQQCCGNQMMIENNFKNSELEDV